VLRTAGCCPNVVLIAKKESVIQKPTQTSLTTDGLPKQSCFCIIINLASLNPALAFLDFFPDEILHHA
jgi:hypothetical protein